MSPDGMGSLFLDGYAIPEPVDPRIVGAHVGSSVPGSCCIRGEKEGLPVEWVVEFDWLFASFTPDKVNHHVAVICGTFPVHVEAVHEPVTVTLRWKDAEGLHEEERRLDSGVAEFRSR